MSQSQQDGTEPVQAHDSLRVKRPISERKLQANRANAKRSTGPRTAEGKAVSRRNALKHGILSLSVDLLPLTLALDLRLLERKGSSISGSLPEDSGLQEIKGIWEKMAKVLDYERDCMQHPDGLEQSGRLVHRYERMLTGQLHRRIRERGELASASRKSMGRSL